MARIRTIKPEFWDSASTAKTSLRGRLLYISMWNWADDYGIGDATPIRLIGFAFPNDDIGVSDYPRLLAEMSERYGVQYFNHEGRPYYYIPEWERHQRTEKRAKQRIPFPEVPQKPLEQAELPVSVGISEAYRGKPEAGTGEQGNRGTKDLSSKQDEFDQWYSHYPRKEAKEAARKAFTKARKTASLEQLIRGVEHYKLTNRGKAREFIALPATWLNAGRWEDETPESGLGPVDVEAILGKDYWTVPEAPAHMDIAEGLAWKKAQRAAHDQEREQLARKKVENLAA